MRKLVSIISSMVFLSFIFSSSTIYATNNVSVSAKAAILIEAETGRILFEKNSSQIMQMASTTKIMTTLLSIESGGLDDYFVVDPNAIKVEGSSMGLLEGDMVTKRVLCYGMLLPSGNDAANATAVKLAGSIEAFSVMMNERAKQIGMLNTNFVTPSGLDDFTDEHYSTALDMALLAREALKNADFREICSSKNARLEYGNPPYVRWLTNSNRLLSSCDGVIGVKTGFTDKAKRCLVSACERNGVTLICVTLNDPNDWSDHSNLYKYGYTQVESYQLTYDNPNLLIPVVGSNRELAPFQLSERPAIALAPGDSKRIEKRIISPRFVYAPILKGDQVGRAEFLLDGEIIATTPLCASEDIPFFSEKEKLTLADKAKKIWKDLKGIFN